MNDNKTYMKAGMEWLCRAQDAARDGGVAGWFSFFKGWSRSYPETTGYIISTFLDYFNKTGKEEHRNRAARMADWILSIQMESGAFTGHHVGVKPDPRVFNTGMVLTGLMRIFKETQDEKYLEAAKKAGDFLAETQETDGSWKKCAFHGLAHTYYTRVAWALLQLNLILPQEGYAESARKNLDWALRQKKDNGWFDKCAFEAGKDPYTHTIAYMVEGLLESGILTKEKKYYEPAMDIAERLLKIYEIKKRMPGTFNEKWRGDFSYSCLTGDAQISVIWHKVYKFSGDARFLNAAVKINDHLKEKQNKVIPLNGIRGGICGSSPVWGAYHPFWVPSWAVKFFVDALLSEEEAMAGLK